MTILRIHFVHPYYYYIIAKDTGDSPRFWKFYLKSVTKDRDILDEGWQGIACAKVYTKWNFIMPTDNGRISKAKIPSELAHWFGGWSTVKEEKNYDKEGKHKSSSWEVFQIINNNEESKILEPDMLLKWKDLSVIFTVSK